MTAQVVPPEPATIPLQEFDDDIKAKYTEVSTSAVGAKVIGCSDDFFVSRDNLIKASPSVSMKGQFGPNGALYDGWESRRHNPTFDWVIIQLGPHESRLSYVDIDTSHFSGNEAPQSQVFGLHLDKPADNLKLSDKDPRWVELLPVVTLGPSSRHIFELCASAKKGVWSALMVRMIPDGGMARFRAYGTPVPPPLLQALPPVGTEPINLLSPLVGGHIVDCSDANFSPPFNLLLTGRGHDMSDGWETRRSQHQRGKYAPGAPLYGQERKEWVVGKLGVPGVISHVEVDSAYHVGNYPVAAGIEATYSEDETPAADAKWITIVRKQPLGPHRQHWFAPEARVPLTATFSHVRCSIYPDGGLKRLRVFGHPMDPTASLTEPARTTLTALPLTYEEFSSYGSVIQGWEYSTSAPKGIPVTRANQDTAAKFHRLAKLPSGRDLSIAQVRDLPQLDVRSGAIFNVAKLEQSSGTLGIMPQGLGAAPGETSLKSGGAYLVVVAASGGDGKPDVSTLRAFMVTAAQGVVYAEGTWHAPLITLNAAMDYACLESAGEFTTVVSDFGDVYIPAYNPKSISAPAPTPAPSTASKLASMFGEGVAHPTPITAKAFAPFGEIIRSYPANEPEGVTRTTTDSTTKLANMGTVTGTYPTTAGAVTSVGVYRATRKIGLDRGKVFDVRFMERHPYTSQAFIPMGKASIPGKGENALGRGGAFLVVVAETGPDDCPDPATLKTFVMESGTGLNYKAGTWHHPVLVLDDTLDLACIESQITTGANGEEVPQADCDLLVFDDEPFGRIAVPDL